MTNEPPIKFLPLRYCCSGILEDHLIPGIRNDDIIVNQIMVGRYSNEKHKNPILTREGGGNRISGPTLVGQIGSKPTTLSIYIFPFRISSTHLLLFSLSAKRALTRSTNSSVPNPSKWPSRNMYKISAILLSRI